MLTSLEQVSLPMELSKKCFIKALPWQKVRAIHCEVKCVGGEAHVTSGPALLPPGHVTSSWDAVRINASTL